MWRKDNRALFAACLQGLERAPEVLLMRDIPQHVNGVSCYDHSMFVAYAAFTMCRVVGLDYRAAARGGLLHDLYLQRWEETNAGLLERLWVHPYLALENARRFGLSPKEEDIIATHMWPLTRPRPAYAESFAVTLADKLCALVEMVHLFRPLGIHKNIRAVRKAILLPVWYA